MHPTQVRLDSKLRKDLQRIAKREQTTASVTLRKALREGVRTMLLRDAVVGYVERRLSLGGAAEVAGVSLSEMAAHLESLGIPYYRYGVEDLEKDSERAAAWLG